MLIILYKYVHKAYNMIIATIFMFQRKQRIAFSFLTMCSFRDAIYSTESMCHRHWNPCRYRHSTMEGLPFNHWVTSDYCLPGINPQNRCQHILQVELHYSCLWTKADKINYLLDHRLRAWRWKQHASPGTSSRMPIFGRCLHPRPTNIN